MASVKKQFSHDLITAEALSFIERHRKERFFLYLPWTIPHANNEGGSKGMEVPGYGIHSGRDWPDPEKGFAAMVTLMDRDTPGMACSKSAGKSASSRRNTRKVTIKTSPDWRWWNPVFFPASGFGRRFPPGKNNRLKIKCSFWGSSTWPGAVTGACLMGKPGGCSSPAHWSIGRAC